MLNSLNLMSNDVEEMEDDFVNPAIANQLEINKGLDRRSTLIQGH